MWRVSAVYEFITSKGGLSERNLVILTDYRGWCVKAAASVLKEAASENDDDEEKRNF